jgi:hypothetical protein
MAGFEGRVRGPGSRAGLDGPGSTGRANGGALAKTRAGNGTDYFPFAAMKAPETEGNNE